VSHEKKRKRRERPVGSASKKGKGVKEGKKLPDGLGEKIGPSSLEKEKNLTIPLGKGEVSIGN